MSSQFPVCQVGPLRGGAGRLSPEALSGAPQFVTAQLGQRSNAAQRETLAARRPVRLDENRVRQSSLGGRNLEEPFHHHPAQF